MAESAGNGNGRDRAHYLSRVLSGLSLSGLAVIVALFIQPMRAELEKLADKQQEDTKMLWEAIRRHDEKHGHAGVLEDVSQLRERVTAAQNMVESESKARSLLDDNRRRELDHIWGEVQRLIQDETMMCRQNGGKEKLLGESK